MIRHDQCSGNKSRNERKTEKEAPIVKNQSKLATVTRTRNKESRVSMYNIPTSRFEQENLMKNEQNEQLGCNIYDATPDHSILKHGLAKSLSNFHLGNCVILSVQSND